MSLVPFSLALGVLSNDPLEQATNYKVSTPVTIKQNTVGTPLASIFLDAAGTTPLTNPSNTDLRGTLEFYVEAGEYIAEYQDNLQLVSRKFSITGQDILAPFGLESKGVWASDQEFTAYNQYMIYDGEAYSPLPATALPYTVGATPDLGFVYQIKLNSLQALSGLSEPSDLDLVYNRLFNSVSSMTLYSGHSVGLKYSTGGTAWAVVADVTQEPLAGGLYAKPISLVDPVDFGADNSGVSDCSGIFESILNKGYRIKLERGDDIYSFDSIVPLTVDGFYINGFYSGATLNIRIPTAAATYNQLFVASSDINNVRFLGVKVTTSSVAFNAFGFYGRADDLILSNNKTVGCGLLTSFRGSSNATITYNKIKDPASEGTNNPYARPIHFNCLFTGEGITSLDISNNQIDGSWTHGIEVSGNDVMDSLDPLLDKNINGAVISGNIVKSLGQANTAGAIWISQAADVSISGNHCELYGDVGIDVEASRNVIVDANTLKNNNKNLAMYGNSDSVTFSNNMCYNTISGLSMFYAKPADNNGVDYLVDIRNTNIKLTNNTFNYNGVVTGFERLDLGSGGDIEVVENTLVNVSIAASYMSLTKLSILNNTITINDSNMGMIPIIVQQSYASGDTSTSPFITNIEGNDITVSNQNSGAFVILVQDNDTAGASVDFTKRLNIKNNKLKSATNVNSIFIQSACTLPDVDQLYTTILSNEIWGSITYSVSGSNREVTKNIQDNTALTGLPLDEVITASGGLATYVTSLIDTASGAVSVSLADGDYQGQIKTITIKSYGGDCTLIVAKHRLSINQVFTFTALAQTLTMQWNVNAWDTVLSTIV